MKNCVAAISPEFNRVVVFNTTADSLHGYPEPIRCPADVSRKSLALYYYTVEDKSTIPINSTTYYTRPGDSLAKRICVHCDNFFLKIYAYIKRTFRLSDRLASWILKLFSK